MYASKLQWMRIFQKQKDVGQQKTDTQTLSEGLQDLAWGECNRATEKSKALCPSFGSIPMLQHLRK